MEPHITNITRFRRNLVKPIWDPASAVLGRSGNSKDTVQVWSSPPKKRPAITWHLKVYIWFILPYIMHWCFRIPVNLFQDRGNSSRIVCYMSGGGTKSWRMESKHVHSSETSLTTARLAVTTKTVYEAWTGKVSVMPQTLMTQFEFCDGFYSLSEACWNKATRLTSSLLLEKNISLRDVVDTHPSILPPEIRYFIYLELQEPKNCFNFQK